jgi:hypothetical protein
LQKPAVYAQNPIITDKSGVIRGEKPLIAAGKKRGFRGEKNPLASRGSCLP